MLQIVSNSKLGKKKLLLVPFLLKRCPEKVESEAMWKAVYSHI